VRRAWAVSARPIAARAVSSLLSLIFIATCARRLPQSEFVASQFAIAGIGVIGLLSDLGLSLETTKARVDGQHRDVAGMLGGRVAMALVLVLPLVALGAASQLQNALGAVVAGVPYLVAIVVRNHGFAVARATQGSRFELFAAPVVNSTESLIAALVVVLTSSLVLSFIAMGAVAVVQAAAILAVVHKADPESFRPVVRMPRGSHLLSGIRRAGAVSLAGLLPRLAAIAVATAPFLGTPLALWLVASARVLDALHSYATVLVIVDDHAAALRGDPKERDGRRLFGFTALGFSLTPMLLVPLLVGRLPSMNEVFATSALSIFLALTYLVSWRLHVLHGSRRRVPAGAIALLLLTPLPSVVAADSTIVLAFAAASALAFMSNRWVIRASRPR
jgi:hypothetical protein